VGYDGMLWQGLNDYSPQLHIFWNQGYSTVFAAIKLTTRAITVAWLLELIKDKDGLRQRKRFAFYGYSKRQTDEKPQDNWRFLVTLA